MLDSGEQLQKLYVTPDGWVVEDVEYFRHFTDHPPPRPFGYLDQLKTDANSWKPVAMWIVGIAFLVLGAAIESGLLTWVGVWLLGSWFCMFLSVVRYFRDSPVVIGVVESLGPHPLLRDHSTAQARLADGREIPVTFLTLLVADTMAEQGRAEVMILHKPRGGYSHGFAARAVSRGTDNKLL